ncbi:MAG: ABC transporter, partial [Bacteroidota bacterium]
MKALSFLNQFFWRYRWRFLLGIIFIALSNYFRVLQPQVIREALDLVIEHINMYRLYQGFDLQADYFSILAQTLLFFAGLVLVLALIMGF